MQKYITFILIICLSKIICESVVSPINKKIYPIPKDNIDDDDDFDFDLVRYSIKSINCDNYITIKEEPRVINQCPNSCTYNYFANNCYPDMIPDICEKMEISCPSRCSYDERLNKCIPENENYVCEKTVEYQCDENCLPKYNHRKYSKCYCTIYSDKMCDFEGCTFSNELRRCIPITNDAYIGCGQIKHYIICDDLILSSCPDNYIFNNTISYCSRFFHDQPCKRNDSTIQYPVYCGHSMRILKCIPNLKQQLSSLNFHHNIF